MMMKVMVMVMGKMMMMMMMVMGKMIATKRGNLQGPDVKEGL